MGTPETATKERADRAWHDYFEPSWRAADGAGKLLVYQTEIDLNGDHLPESVLAVDANICPASGPINYVYDLGSKKYDAQYKSIDKRAGSFFFYKGLPYFFEWESRYIEVKKVVIKKPIISIGRPFFVPGQGGGIQPDVCVITFSGDQ